MVIKKGQHISLKTEFKKGNRTWNTGLNKENDMRLKLTARKISDTRKRLVLEGKLKFWNKGKKGLQVSWLKGLTKENDERVKKMAERMRNKPKTEETRRKLSETRKRLFKEGKLKNWSEGLTKETSEKVRIASEKTRKTRKEKKLTEELWKNHREKMILAITKMIRKRWSNSDFRNKQLKLMLKGQHNKPNKKEKQLDYLLQTNFPNEWKYVGNGEIVLGDRNPDFINCNGKKILIELFGDWWHSKECADYYKKEYESPEQRIEHFAKYGFRTLIIWENELEETEKVIDKIRGILRDEL